MNDENVSKPQANGARAKTAMKETLRLVKKLGGGAADLLGKLRKDRSPEAMLGTIETSLDANRERRESASGRTERLFKEISEKKKGYAAAPAARKRVLEMELRSKLSEYKAAERELGVLLENERVLSSVKGRFNEMLAYDLRGVSEIVIDDVIDAIDDKAAEADAVMDATLDLEKAGRRRDRESDTESLWDELSGFESDGEGSLGDELKSFDMPDVSDGAVDQERKGEAEG